MKNTHIHSIALFWCASGLAIGAISTRYIPTAYVIGIGAVIVALMLAHHIHTWLKKQQRAANTFNAQNRAGRKRTSSKKRLPKMKGA